MKPGTKLSSEAIEAIAIEFSIKIMLDTISQHGYRGSRVIVDEFFRTLDDLLTEFHNQNEHRIEEPV